MKKQSTLLLLIFISFFTTVFAQNKSEEDTFNELKNQFYTIIYENPTAASSLADSMYNMPIIKKTLQKL